MATKTKAKGAAKPAAGAKSEAKPKTEAASKKAEVERKADAGAKSAKAGPKSAGKELKMESAEDKSLGLRLIQAGEAEKKVAETSRHGNSLYPVEVEEDGTAKATAAGKKKITVPASQRITVGSVVMDLLQEDPDVKFEQVLEKVKAVKPESKFNAKHLAWYRSKMKKERAL